MQFGFAITMLAHYSQPFRIYFAGKWSDRLLVSSLNQKTPPRSLMPSHTHKKWSGAGLCLTPKNDTGYLPSTSLFNKNGV